MVAEVDYPAPDIQIDRTLSHGGKRRMQGKTTQNAGIYPGWDRFGRVKKHAWVDGGYTTGTGHHHDWPHDTRWISRVRPDLAAVCRVKNESQPPTLPHHAGSPD